MTIRKALIACAAAVGVLGVAGCGQLENTSGPSATSSPSSEPPSSSSQAPTRSSTAAPEPTATTTSPPAPEPTTTQAPGAAGSCTAADLSVSLGGTEGAAGSVYRTLTFRNTGEGTCTMHGHPGVSYVGGSNGAQVGESAARTGGNGSVVSLAPGDTASAQVREVQVGNFDAAECKPTPVRGLRVYPPDDTASEFVAQQGTGCAGSPPEPQLTIGPVQ